MAWTLLHKLRRAIVRSGRDRLSGIVEVDETYIGGEKTIKHGRGAAGKTLIVIAVQLIDFKIGWIRLRQAPNASTKSLEDAVQQAIEQGSAIHTDEWNGYNCLCNLGYIRKIVR